MFADRQTRSVFQPHYFVAENKPRENHHAANVREIFNRIYKGSMPAVISGQNKNTQIFYSSYVTTYIERDVRALSDLIDSLKFLK